MGVKYNPTDDCIYLKDETESWIKWKEAGIKWDGIIYDGTNFYEGLSSFVNSSGNFSVSNGTFSASSGDYASKGKTRTFSPSGIITLNNIMPTKGRKYIDIYATFTASTAAELSANVQTNATVVLGCTAIDSIDTSKTISGSISNNGSTKLRIDVSSLSDEITLQLKPSATLSHYHNLTDRVLYLSESCSITITKIMCTNV